jgi:hypothetical protein
MSCIDSECLLPDVFLLFRFALGLNVFAGTYYSIILIVRERLAFFVEMARDSNAKQSIKFLKTGCYIFFSIWILYPILWFLGDKVSASFCTSVPSPSPLGCFGAHASGDAAPTHSSLSP